MSHYLTEQLLKINAFVNHPVIVADAGVSGGKEPHWNIYGNQLQFIGFDPDETECNKLNREAKERGKNERYI